MDEKHDWTKSSYSDGDGDGGQCIEWAPPHAPEDNIPIRDSKDPARTPLAFSPTAWNTFIRGVRTSHT
ncbi:DUF397 domain-containing protein [Streptomyces iconiensis]|uniref:DUF397 domain-containing protein n=1 Tax=Streptomyces iconiensis TaxID=1384038 RepID=A0ABT6ZTN4_9ACTN|nr:DUF397 domain-containing protein [Streptomyces iconiensis]MDJ1131818.1 DUF397 domain-containing protein [Streptomyces iconiensis]